MDKLTDIKKKIEEIQTKSLVASDMKAFVELVLGVVKNAKDNFDSISKENIDTIKQALAYIEKEHSDILDNVSKDNKNTIAEFNSKIKEVKDFIKEVTKIIPKDGYTPVKGQDYFDGITPVKGVDYNDGKDGSSDTAGEIATKLETLKDEDRLDASAIKNLPQFIENKANGGGWRNLFQMHDVDVATVADNDILQYDSATSTWKNVTPQAIEDVNWGEITGDQSLVNVSGFSNDAGYITSYTESDTLQSVTDRGAVTTNAIKMSNTLLVGSTPVNQRLLSVKQTSGSNPALEIESNSRTLRVTAATPYIEFYDDSPYERLGFFGYGINNVDYTIGSDKNGKIQFSTNGYLNVRANINENGMYIGGNGTPSAQLHVVDTTEQLRLGYDASNYGSFTVGSAGKLNISTTAEQVGINSSNAYTTLMVQKDAINSRVYYPLAIDASTQSKSVLGSGTGIIFGRSSGGNITGAIASYANGTTAGVGIWGTPSVTAGSNSVYSTSTPDFYVHSNGNVGAGTIAPLGRIDARATSGAQIVGSYDSSNYYTTTVASTGQTTFEITGSAKYFRYTTGGASLPAIDSETIATFTKTTAAGSNAQISIVSGTSGNAVLRFGDTGSEGRGQIRYNNSTDGLEFYTAAEVKAYLSSTGQFSLGATANASAILQADSTTQGFLPPRMTTTQKNAISSPATGLVLFDTTLAKLCVYTGSAWETITSA